jgi:IS5 family transposase
MRGVRSFLVLLVIAAALGGYLYYDSKRAPSDQKKLEKVFADVQSDKIDKVTVKSDKGETTTAQKQGTSWQLTQPVATGADESEVSGITSNLASMEVQRVVDEQPGDLKQYGLDPARVEVAFASGGKERRILLGQKTPTGSDMYAKLPDKPRVFLISSFLDTTFDKSPFDLRDKTILKIDRDKTDRIEIQSADHTVKLTRQGGEWKIAAPVEARADFGAIEGILGRLNSAPMKSIVSTNADAAALKEFGLDKPDATVRVGAGSAEAGLAIGKAAAEGTVYARDLSRPMVFTVEKALADDLKKSPDDFRVKDLFDSRSFNTTRVDITYKGQTLAFEKDKENWKQVAPANKAADTAKVEALLTALTNTRATGFVDKIAGTGLESPELSVAVKYEDGQKQEKVVFARKGADVFAQRQGDASAAKIDASQLDAIEKALDALK